MNRLLIALTVLAAAASPGGAQIRVTKRADLTQPVALQPNQGAILVAFRRPDAMSAGKSGTVAFARYDPAARDLVPQPKGAKKAGDTTTYWAQATSAERRQAVEYHLLPVTAGDYVMFGAMPTKLLNTTFCMGAPTFRVNPGEVVYFGDLTPYLNVRMAGGDRGNAMAYSADLAGAQAALRPQPALLAALRPAELRNEATYACAGQAMLAYAVPGAPALPPAPPALQGGAAQPSRR